jgi:hypothetical protein
MMPIDRLETILSELPPHLQQDVVDYAQHLLVTKDQNLDSGDRPRFYLCPVCFAAASQPLECHGNVMIACNADKPEDCKPLMDEAGNFNSRAPRWFITSIARSFDNQ